MKYLLLFWSILIIIFIRWLFRADWNIIFLNFKISLVIFWEILEFCDASIHFEQRIGLKFEPGIFGYAIGVSVLVVYPLTRSLIFVRYLFFHVIFCNGILFAIWHLKQALIIYLALREYIFAVIWLFLGILILDRDIWIHLVRKGFFEHLFIILMYILNIIY